MALIRRNLYLSLAVLLLASVAAAQTGYVVIKPVINMYYSATLDADVTSQAIHGTTIQELKADKPVDDWLYIQTPDEYKGWIEAAGVRKLKPGETYAGAKAMAVEVTNRAANVYREQDVTKHAPIIVLPFESPIEIEGAYAHRGGRWVHVKLADGREGWVQAGDVRVREQRTLTIEQAIELAKKFMGVTYTWGGTSSFGYDCSGFMQMLMRQRGILMPRDADIQAAWSGLEPVKREELKAGDLLYFGSKADHITHTGMYIGNGEFIHDTTHDHPMVQISRLDDQPWTRLLVACRRAKEK